MASEKITISKDEYIDLLRCKADLAVRMASDAKATVQYAPRNEPQKWMNSDEIAEILRLHGKGVRAGEIAKKTGRPYSTVQRCIRNSSRAAIK